MNVFVRIVAICCLFVFVVWVYAARTTTMTTTTTTISTTTPPTPIKMPSRPTPEWLEQCVTDVKNDTNLYKPFAGVPRRGTLRGPHDALFKGKSIMGNKYRLGDCIRFCSTCNNTLLGENADYLPNLTYFDTIAGMYGAMSKCIEPDGKENMDVVEQIFQLIEEEKRPGFEKPGPRDFIVHLRLGDVIEHASQLLNESSANESRTNADATYLLLNGGRTHHPDYIKVKTIFSVNDYIDMLENITDSGKSIDTIQFVGGSHEAEEWQQSKLYAHCLSRGIAEAGYQVQLQIEGNHPDQDFYFMAHASRFMLSTGGFSRVIGKMVVHLGGQIVGAQNLEG